MASPGLVAYVVDGDGGLRIIDVTDPAHPNELGFHNTPGHTLSTVAAGSLLYVVGGFSGLRILNVADPEQPLEIGSFPAWGDCADVAVVGDIAYTVTNWGGLIILNVRDPRAPVLLGYRACRAAATAWPCVASWPTACRKTVGCASSTSAT